MTNHQQTTEKKIHLNTHPLVQHKLSMMRDQATDIKLFRELMHEISLLLFYEATRDFKTVEDTVVTPLEETKGLFLAQKAPVIIPILRAGFGMLNAFIELLPTAKVGHIGLKRNEETLVSECYYFKIPEDSAKRSVFLCDPMLATGGSTVVAISMLKEQGIKNIYSVNIIAAPEGIKRVHDEHPDVPIYVAGIDPGLNEHAYIVPGLGDAGDRQCGTS